MSSEAPQDRIINALNEGDRYRSCSVDHNGDVFDALHGEFGAVILTARQLANLTKLIT